MLRGWGWPKGVKGWSGEAWIKKCLQWISIFGAVYVTCSSDFHRIVFLLHVLLVRMRCTNRVGLGVSLFQSRLKLVLPWNLLTKGRLLFKTKENILLEDYNFQILTNSYFSRLHTCNMDSIIDFTVVVWAQFDCIKTVTCHRLVQFDCADMSPSGQCEAPSDRRASTLMLWY